MIFSRFRAKSYATVSPLGSSDGTLTSVAGAFLSPGFSAAAANFGSGLGRLSTVTTVSKIVNNCCMHCNGVRFNTENGFREGKSTDFFAVHVQNFNV
jgi:hypothetical protein